MATMIVHDTRLHGKTPLNYNFVMLVNGNRSVDTMIRTVASSARSRGRLSTLHIFCHGYEGHDNIGHQQTDIREHGGFGLHLCREGLDLYNVGKTRAWQGLIGRIVIFACAPADTAPGNEGTEGDGQRLCGELALWSGAEVIAARDTQYYNTVAASYSGGRKIKDTIDFGDWEGPVYSFSPQTGYPTRISPSAFSMSNPSTI